MIEIYDKAAWHIDAGEDAEIVLKKMELILSYLKKHDMLTDEGIEIYELGADESCSIHERMVNDKGAEFMKNNYDSLLELELCEMEKKLSE